jgi:hypothetical protein
MGKMVVIVPFTLLIAIGGFTAEAASKSMRNVALETAPGPYNPNPPDQAAARTGA